MHRSIFTVLKASVNKLEIVQAQQDQNVRLCSESVTQQTVERILRAVESAIEITRTCSQSIRVNSVIIALQTSRGVRVSLVAVRA
jgi:hypothetical protein